MNAQQLRNSILQQAIQGKLVPQDPNDEPASVLLQRIRKEKERLVKEGKLKKKDLESKPIEEDEIPFEIPESWEWVKLVDVFELR
jgi:type I restriction enzyme S subunit